MICVLYVLERSTLSQPLRGMIVLSVTASQCCSQLVSKAYVVVGHASGALHIISVLQAYQADLLKVREYLRSSAALQILHSMPPSKWPMLCAARLLPC